MTVQDIIQHLENIAPADLQENYDNAGLITGNAAWECTGALIALDVTEDVIDEAIRKKCNLVIAHHPIVFGGLKKITGRNYVERTVIAAIKQDIAIYAIHTNLDNVINGVNGRIADRIGLVNREILAPKKGVLRKIQVFVPVEQAEQVRTSIFRAGAGNIGNYSECSFTTAGEGTFKAGTGAHPFLGSIGERYTAQEVKIEMVYPVWQEKGVLKAMFAAHPYEEVAYDIFEMHSELPGAGSGLIGNLPKPVAGKEFLQLLKNSFGLQVVKHTPLKGNMVSKVAVCGGAGSFLIKTAIAAGADYYVSGDIKYHEFFDADGRIVVADIGHYESEQYTIELLFDILKEKYPTFAVLKTEINTNPVQYFL